MRNLLFHISSDPSFSAVSPSTSPPSSASSPSSWAKSYFALNNPLFLDILVALLFFVIYRTILRGRWPRVAQWAKEASIVFLIFMCYDVSRFFALSDKNQALRNAEKVYHFEKATGMDVEPAFQKAVVHHESFVRFLGTFYLAAHWGGIIAFFVWAITRIGNSQRRRREYVVARGQFVIMNLIAVISFLTYPCAPPRMIPGFTDSIGEVIDVYSSTRRFVNPYAAMPSMHMGYSLFFTFTTIKMLFYAINYRMSPRKRANSYSGLEAGASEHGVEGEALMVFEHSSGVQMVDDVVPVTFHYLMLLPFVILVYPCFMFFTIISTGNHFILDAIAGAIAFGLAILIYHSACVIVDKWRRWRRSSYSYDVYNVDVDAVQHSEAV